MNDYNVLIGDDENQVSIVDEKTINVNGKTYFYELIEIENKKYLLKIDDYFYDVVHLNKLDNNHTILVNNSTLNLTIRTSLEDKAYKLLSSSQSSGEKKTNVKSPMPGLVLKINKSVGDKVSKGETILILEAMKMENEIKSPMDGTILEIFVEEGKPIEKNKNLFSIK